MHRAVDLRIQFGCPKTEQSRLWPSPRAAEETVRPRDRGPKIDDGKPAGESQIPDLCGAPVTSTWLDVVLLSRSAAAQLGTFFLC